MKTPDVATIVACVGTPTAHGWALDDALKASARNAATIAEYGASPFEDIAAAANALSCLLESSEASGMERVREVRRALHHLARYVPNLKGNVAMLDVRIGRVERLGGGA